MLAINDPTLLKGVVGVVGSLSFLGSAFLIFSYMLVHNSKSNFGKRLILQLSIADFGASLSYIAIACGIVETKVGCDIQAANMQFFELSSVLWTSCIAFHLFLSIVLEYKRKKRIFFAGYSIFSWGIPALTTIIVFVYDEWGLSGDWCWVPSTAEHGPLFRILFFYGILLTLFACNILSFILVQRKVVVVTAASAKYAKNSVSNVDKKLVMFLVAFVIIWLFPVMNRLIQFAAPGTNLPWLDFLQALFNPSMGLLDFIAYVDKSHGWRFWKTTFSAAKSNPDADTEMAASPRIHAYGRAYSNHIARPDEFGASPRSGSQIDAAATLGRSFGRQYLKSMRLNSEGLALEKLQSSVAASDALLRAMPLPPLPSASPASQSRI